MAEKPMKKEDPGAIVAKAPEKRKLIDQGLHFARCISMIHIGTVMESFKDQPPAPVDKIRIGWELPDVMVTWKEGEDPKPATISAEYTLSLAPKAKLLALINSWRGVALNAKELKNFHVNVLLGKPCMLQISHKAGTGKNEGNTYEEISAVTTVPKKDGKPVFSGDQINESFIFNYTGYFNPEAVEKMPDFIKNKIKSSKEWKEKYAIYASEHATLSPQEEAPELDEAGNIVRRDLQGNVIPEGEVPF